MAELNFPASDIESKQNKVAIIDPDAASDEQYPSVPAVVNYVANTATDKSYMDNNFANALKGAASGTSVYVEDVSPIEHDVSLKLSSDSITDFSSVKVAVASGQIESIGEIEEAISTIRFPEVIFLNGNRKILIDDTLVEGSYDESKFIFHPSNWDTYTGIMVNSNSYARIRYDKADGETIESIHKDVPVEFYWEHTSSEDGEVDRLILSYYDVPEVEGYYAAMGEVYVKDLTIDLIAQEGSSIGTCEIVAPSADGTVEGVKSIAPAMAVATDTEGVTVEFEYNRDINTLDAGAPDVDLSEYVKNTDYATAAKAGLVIVNSTKGIGRANTNPVLEIQRATSTEIDDKGSSYKPIVPKNLDYAVKVGLTTNTETLTDEEKEVALNWLGVTAKLGDVESALDSIIAIQESLIGGETI